MAGQAEAILNSLGLPGQSQIDVVTVPTWQSAPPSPPGGAYHSSLSFGNADEPPPDPGVYVTARHGDDWT